MSRFVTVTAPSFPDVQMNEPFNWPENKQWQVLCGDAEHYRIGIYCPLESSRSEIKELEKHTCPEFFMLISGAITLVLKKNGHEVEVPLKAGEAIYVDVPHNGFCPNGPHSGQAVVVERDLFTTEYREPEAW